MPDVAWITCRVLPEPDPDEAPALAALRAAGLSVEPLAWDDPAAPDPADFTLCVPRSCWTYHEDPPAFARFVDRVAARSRLANGPAVLRWNLHKSYLLDLERGGVPVVPTALAPRGGSADLGALCAARGWGGVVIKPAISAASAHTRAFAPDERAAAQAFLDGHLPRRDMLVQPFVDSVRTSGERALVWLDGEPSHVVVKRPRFAGEDEQVSPAERPGDDERAVAEAALACAARAGGFPSGELLYARVDTVAWQGRRVVGELELLEPSLFLVQHPPALERFVRAVAARVAEVGAR